jgi:hypothetical protein
MSEIIYLSNVRLSFPHIAEPQRTRNEQTGVERVSYNADLVMPADHPGFAQFMQRYGQMAVEKWKEHAQAVMNLIQGDRKTRCYGRGEEKMSKKTFHPYDGYVGMVFISAGRETMPQIIQGDGTPVDAENTMACQALARKMYGGCRVNAAVKPWLQENKHGRGIRCDLIAIQFAGDDKPFGEAAPDVSGVFGAVQSAPGAPVAAAPVMPLPPFMMG